MRVQTMTVRQSETVGRAFIAGPALMAGYAVVRLAGRAVSDYGPGAWWTVAHVLSLAGLLSFVLVLLGLRMTAGVRGGKRVAVEAATWAGLLGVAALVVQAVIDLAVGFLTVDKPAMSDMFGRVQDVPGVMPLVYTVVPMLFWLGLSALVALLAFLRRDVVRGWAPVLVLAGIVLAAMSLDLLAVGAVCLGTALLPMRRGLPERGGRPGAARSEEQSFSETAQ
ncbi:hypothetical protein ACFCX0_20745 [Streptomyces sp. NPDC056352]|uniref:hypothetical protein n=1 Tax=Streptomyces sp. NPDC056352 TaxID=3345791 RepID=UPI0035DA4B11